MFRRTFILISVAVGASALLGCSTSAEFIPGKLGRGDDPTMRTQLTAFAASPDNRYPENAQPSDDLKAAAIVDRKKGAVRIYNFTEETLSEGKVWVNREYVTPLRAIAPRGKAVIPRNLFYNGVGTPLSQSTAGISRVEIQRQGKLNTVMGPAFE